MGPTSGGLGARTRWGFAAGDVNLYRYVANNSLVSIDPSGSQLVAPRWFVELMSGLLNANKQIRDEIIRLQNQINKLQNTLDNLRGQLANPCITEAQKADILRQIQETLNRIIINRGLLQIQIIKSQTIVALVSILRAILFNGSITIIPPIGPIPGVIIVDNPPPPGIPPNPHWYPIIPPFPGSFPWSPLP